MKLSVSLPDEDVAFLDRYAASQGTALGLRWCTRPFDSFAPHSSDRVQDAWAEWAEGPDADLWETAISDGLS